SPERRTDMRPSGVRGQSPNPTGQSQDGRGGPPPDPLPPTPPDALAAAEELRAALAGAAAKAARLVALLKAGRREKRALAGVWEGLKRLSFGGPGGPQT